MVAFFEWLISLVCGDLNITSLTYIQDEITKSMSGVFSEDMRVIYEVFAQIGVYLLLIYFCMDLLDKLSSENFSLDVLILNFVKLIIGYALILNGFDIIQGLSGLADWAGEAIIAAAESSIPGIGDEGLGGIGDILDFIMKIAACFLPLPWANLIDIIISSIITQIVVTLVCCQRAIRIAIRLFVAPFVLADVLGHGMNNNAMHYLKKLFALFLQGPIMIAAIAVANAAYGTMASIKFMNLLVTIVCAKILFDSKSIAEDLTI